MASRSPAAMQIDLGALDQRVLGLEQGLTRLSNDTSHAIANLATTTTQQVNALSNQIGKLDTSLQERAKIPWPALAVMLSFLTVIGGLVYWPVREGQSRIEAAMVKIVDTVPTNKEIDVAARRRDDWQRYAEDRLKRGEADLDSLQMAIVPRGEHEEKWRSADQRFADAQRQVDAIKADFSGLYSPRDALTSMQRRIEDLERRLTLARTSAQP